MMTDWKDQSTNGPLRYKLLMRERDGPDGELNYRLLISTRTQKSLKEQYDKHVEQHPDKHFATAMWLQDE